MVPAYPYGRLTPARPQVSETKRSIPVERQQRERAAAGARKPASPRLSARSRAGSLDPPPPARRAAPVVSVDVTVRARPGRLSGLSVLHSNSSFYGDFVWVRRELIDPFR